LLTRAFLKLCLLGKEYDKMTISPIEVEIMAHIPAEQRRGKELAHEGMREAVYVADERSAVWTVWNCDSQEVLDEVTKTLSV
jgi:hypothetical protein